jgi:hypothetical protein
MGRPIGRTAPAALPRYLDMSRERVITLEDWQLFEEATYDL